MTPQPSRTTCACGCGQELPKAEATGRPRHYVDDHRVAAWKRANPTTPRPSAETVQAEAASELSTLLALRSFVATVGYVPNTLMTGKHLSGEVLKSRGHEAMGADPAGTTYYGHRGTKLPAHPGTKLPRPSGNETPPPAEPSMWIDWTTPDPTNDPKEID